MTGPAGAADASAGPPRPSLAPPQGVLLTQQAHIAALLDQRAAMLQQPGISLQDAAAGHARLVAAAQRVMDAAFYSNPDFDGPMVVNHTGAVARGSGVKLQAACDVLAGLGELLPLDSVLSDVVRRLSNSEPFLDFAASDPRAR